MAAIAGADGCMGGWIVVSHDTDREELSWRVVKSVDQVFDMKPELDVLAIDVSIGLPESGSRLCDLMARSTLGPARGRSVFPAPIRAMLTAESHQAACRLGKQVDGRGIPIQCWSIVPKIREVDDFLRSHPSRREHLREVHPEVCFWALAGSPMSYAKKKREGRAERLKVLEGVYGDAVRGAIADCAKQGAKSDDVIDAFVALWSAGRIYNGIAIIFPKERQVDHFGLRMEILA